MQSFFHLETLSGLFMISVLILTRSEKLSAEILNRSYENIILQCMIEHKNQNKVNYEAERISLY